MPTAIVTGASRGLGAALARELARRGWRLIIDARHGDALSRIVAELSGEVWGIPGDVTDPAHRSSLADAAREMAPVHLLVNNASTLGPSPLPNLDGADLEALRLVLETNVVAPLSIYQLVSPHLAEQAVVVNVTSDAAIEPYPGWGLYGASKAALDQITAIAGAERPELAIYSFDPGDMRTDMHQAAFPGEDISDRPEPESVVPALLRLIEHRPPSGRVTAKELLTAV